MWVTCGPHVGHMVGHRGSWKRIHSINTTCTNHHMWVTWGSHDSVGRDPLQYDYLHKLPTCGVHVGAPCGSHGGSQGVMEGDPLNQDNLHKTQVCVICGAHGILEGDTLQSKSTCTNHVWWVTCGSHGVVKRDPLQHYLRKQPHVGHMWVTWGHEKGSASPRLPAQSTSSRPHGSMMVSSKGICTTKTTCANHNICVNHMWHTCWPMWVKCGPPGIMKVRISQTKATCTNHSARYPSRDLCIGVAFEPSNLFVCTSSMCDSRVGNMPSWNGIRSTKTARESHNVGLVGHMRPGRGSALQRLPAQTITCGSHGTHGSGFAPP
jgi:hypothetical protein